MVEIIAEADRVVRAAEAALCKLMQTGVREGQYDRVAVLARWAEQLSQITANGAVAVQTETATTNRGAAPSGTARPTSSRKKTRRRKSKYPIFRRSGDNLVKIAWSKTSKAEYQHRASKNVICALIEKMSLPATGDALITMDNVPPLVVADQPEVPAYQSYTCLAWLGAQRLSI